MSSTDIREPWFRQDHTHAHHFEREAAAEIAVGHELYGLGLTAIAKCGGCDDVVFRVADDTFAIVHLSWTSKPERLPWPPTTRLGGLIAVEAAMDQHEH